MVDFSSALETMVSQRGPQVLAAAANVMQSGMNSNVRWAITSVLIVAGLSAFGASISMGRQRLERRSVLAPDLATPTSVITLPGRRKDQPGRPITVQPTHALVRPEREKPIVVSIDELPGDSSIAIAAAKPHRRRHHHH